jgi:transposase
LAPLPTSWGYQQRYLDELSPERLEAIEFVSERQRKLPAEQRTRYTGAELAWPLALEDGPEVALRALFVHSSEEQAAIRNSRASSLERAEAKLARVVRGVGGRYYPDVKAVERKLAQILQGTPGRFIATEIGERDDKPTLSYHRNQQAINAAEQLDGIYCLITNLPATDADHATLLAHYKEQERVERGHRTLKGPLRVRPLFVQNDNRMIALLAVCCFALMIYTLIERDARQHYPDGLPALGEGRTGPATARAVFHLLQDTELIHHTSGVSIEPPAPARELYQHLTA